MSGSHRSGTFHRHLTIVASIATVVYLIWRLTTVSFDAPVQMFYLALELHAGLSFGLFVFSTWETDALAWPGPRSDAGHRVAVCITTYNEDEQVLLPTVAAAVALRTDHETWVLDDGGRAWVKEMAEQLGARYLSRADRTHAKAGNLNHAFGVIDADLFAILDADHIPAKDFLLNTLGYFEDPSVALVQTPQDFYNLESFEHLGDYAEEALFYRVIQPGKNRWNAAFWCGTSAIVRADALDSIGGVATASVTEDLLTTVHLLGKGWRTVFHHEVLARGLAPASYKEFMVQRTRWATGAMQIVRSRRNPWLAEHLSLGQRLAFTASLTGWFESLRVVGYLLLAAVVVLTGVVPVAADPAVFLTANLTLLGLTSAAHVSLARGRHRLMPAMLFEFLRIPMSLTAARQLVLGGSMTFQVTPKGRSGDDRRIPQVPLSLVGLATLAALGLNVSFLTRLGAIDGPTGIHVDVAATVLVGNLVMLALAAKRIRRQDFGDERRRARRFERDLRCRVGIKEGLLRHPSTTGGHIAFRAQPGNHVLSLLTREGPVELRCWLTPAPNGGTTVEFGPGQYRERAALARTLYSEVQEMPMLPREVASHRVPVPEIPIVPGRRSGEEERHRPPRPQHRSTAEH